MSDFSAIYLPALPPGQSDPSRRGFATADEAQEFVFSQMCKGCKEQRKLFLDGVVKEPLDMYEAEEWPEEWPPCTCEWVVVPTDKSDGTFLELMEAAGWQVVYEKQKLAIR